MKTKKALKKLGAWKSFKEQMCIEGISHKEYFKEESQIRLDGVWGAFVFSDSIKGHEYWRDIAICIDNMQIGLR